MRQFRKRPVVIDAEQLSEDNLEVLEQWCRGSIKGIAMPRSKRAIDIQTYEGEMRAEIGDWIIKGVEGEFYPCRDSIFKATYDEVQS